MDTADYIEAKEIIFTAAGMSGDKDFKNLPRGYYISIISDAFRELNIDSRFIDGHADMPMPATGHLTLQLPNDCFEVIGVYVYTGDKCNFNNSQKLWNKNNYYTEGGTSYIANDKGYNNRDPYYTDHYFANKNDKSLIRYDNATSVNNLLFYNIQNGNLMLSASVKAVGNKIHVHYKSTGCDVGDAPIIPRFFKIAIEDYTTETALRFRMANEPSMAKMWASMQQLYAIRLDINGMNGSWFKAIQRVKKMSQAQRKDLGEYLSRGAWATGR